MSATPEKSRQAGHSTYTATFTPDEKGWIVAQVVEVPGAVSQGRTMEEARANVTEALELMLDWLREEGQEVPAPAAVTVGPVTVSSR